MIVLPVAGGAGLMKFGVSWLVSDRPAPSPDSVAPLAIALPAPALSPSPATVQVSKPAPRPAPAAAPAAPAPVAMGRLVVNATPWAELYVDGRSVGNTPVVDLPLKAGTHQLRLVRDGFEPELRTVVVTRGQTLRVTGIQLRESQP
jgi:serine/threonine-protein kinase